MAIITKKIQWKSILEVNYNKKFFKEVLKLVIDDNDFTAKGRLFQNDIAAKQEVFLP